MKDLGFYNGKYDETEKMVIPMNDRVCYFGDGVYDATYSRNYKIFTLEEHVDRFWNSAKLLDINIPYTKEEFKALLNDLVRKVDTDENFVYFQATRATGKRNHCYGENEKANIFITVTPKEILDVYKKIKLITVEDTRFFHCNIKTLNLIPNVMASQKAKNAGCDEAIFHRGERVTECAHSNVHIIKDGIFITAPTDNLILPGIARKHLISACESIGIPVDERPFTLTELFDADEILISSAGSLGLACEELDGKSVGGKSPDILRKIQDKVLSEFLECTE